MSFSLPEEPTLIIPNATREKIKRWLLAFDVFNVASSLIFTQAIWVVYLFEHGYSPLAIGLLETLFHVAKFIAEVPTGAFADLVGRRASLIGFCLIGASAELLFLAPTPPLIILSFVLSGVAYAFRGGAAEALLWDIASQPTNSQKTNYSHLVSRMVMVGLVGEISGPAVGGLLGHFFAVAPFIALAGARLISIAPLLALPQQLAAQHEQPQPIAHIVLGLRAAWRDPTLIGLLLVDALITSTWTTVGYYYQLYLHNLGVTLTIIGLVVTAAMGTNAIMTAVTPRIMRWLTPAWLVSLCVGLQIIGLLLTSIPQPAISMIGYVIGFQIGVAVLYPAMSTYINERSPAAQRATVLSFQTGLFSAAMIVIFPLFGLGISHFAYSIIYLVTACGLVLGLLGVYIMTRLRRRQA